MIKRLLFSAASLLDAQGLPVGCVGQLLVDWQLPS